jgi:hypothetical protein
MINVSDYKSVNLGNLEIGSTYQDQYGNQFIPKEKINVRAVKFGGFMGDIIIQLKKVDASEFKDTLFNTDGLMTQIWAKIK